MTTLIEPAHPAEKASATDLLGIVQVTIPVTDLARSAAWYRDLLGLDYIREFGRDDRVTGCALFDWTARYVIALRLGAATQGRADLRGEHPVILEARDAAATERIRNRPTRLGIGHTGGVHADGSWTEFTDPDGICVRIVHEAAGPHGFLGVIFTADDVETYAAPRLQLPDQPTT